MARNGIVRDGEPKRQNVAVFSGEEVAGYPLVAESPTFLSSLSDHQFGGYSVFAFLHDGCVWATELRHDGAIRCVCYSCDTFRSFQDERGGE